MSGRMWEFVKAQWDTLVTIGAAIVLAILSVLDVLGDENIAAATLGVLALLCITIVKDRQARGTDVGEVRQLRDAVASIEALVRADQLLRPVAPSDIGEQLASALPTTDRWRFKGGTGSYLRAKTLPEVALNARALRDVWIELLPPDDAKVCRAYAGYRSSRQAEGTGQSTGRWTIRSVRVGAYATIVAAIWYTKHTSLRAHLALSPTRSTLRFDLCEHFVMITNDDPRTRALRIEGGSTFFRSVEQELRISFDQARKLDINGAGLPRNEIDADDVRRALADVTGLQQDESFLTDEVCDEIAVKWMSKEHASRFNVGRGGAEYPYPNE